MYSPKILWIETSDLILLTIEVLDSMNESIVISQSNINIEGTSENKQYMVDLDISNKIDTNKSFSKVNPRNIELTLFKQTSELWGQLTSKKRNDIYTNWQKWNEYQSESEYSELSNLSDIDSEISEYSDDEINIDLDLEQNINLDNIDITKDLEEKDNLNLNDLETEDIEIENLNDLEEVII